MKKNTNTNTNINDDKSLNDDILDDDTVVEIIEKINLFINNIKALADNYNLDENNVKDIYELLLSNTMMLIFHDNLDELKTLFNYHFDMFNKIIKSITYEDICKIIKKYLMISSINNEKTLTHDITRNLLKININFIKKKIYTTAPRLLLTSESVIIDMMFQEESASKYLIEAIEWIKKQS